MSAARGFAASLVLLGCAAAPPGPPPRVEPAPLGSAASAAPGASWAAPAVSQASPAAPAPAAPRTPFLQGVSQISVGGGHACALLGSGEVACWGSNMVGQLGVGFDGRSTERSQTRPHLVGRLPPIASVAAGSAHTCAVDQRGRVFCWGSAAGGMVSPGAGSSALSGEFLGLPVEMPLGEGKASLVALARKGHAACAVVESEVRCWDTARTISVDGRLASPPRPRGVGLTGVSALALGHGKVCAVAQGGLWCWRDGQLPTPAAWSPGDAIVPVKVSIGEMYACVAAASGEARCWWSLIDDFWKKPPNRAVRWPKKTATRAVSVGESPVCTVDDQGQVDCFLSDEGGLTPEAAARSWATKKMEPHSIGNVSQAIDVGLGPGQDAFGYGFGCALRARPDERGAQVFCWGDNESGQLGNGSFAPSLAAVPVLGFTAAGQPAPAAPAAPAAVPAAAPSAALTAAPAASAAPRFTLEPGQGACTGDAGCFVDDICVATRCQSRRPAARGSCPDVVSEWDSRGASCVCHQGRCAARWPGRR